MGIFKRKQYKIDNFEPDDFFIEARQIAGYQLQKQFEVFNPKEIQSSYDGFKWIKAEMTYPAFDHLNFAYKNSIFSVFIEIIEPDDESNFDERKQKILFEACDKYDLVPCLFRVNLKFDGNRYKPVAAESEWNLVNGRTGGTIDPVKVAGDSPKKMSEWELQNFSIQVVRGELEKSGHQITSFCDLPEINPQIFFADKKKRISWVIVKHVLYDEELDYRKWTGLEEGAPQLKPYDGFFASVRFCSANSKSTSLLYRGDPMFVRYLGLERIYVA